MMKWTYANSIRQFVGMKDEGLPDNAVTGDVAYTIDNQKEYINLDGNWYLKTNGYSSACDMLTLKITIDDTAYNGVFDGTDVTVTVPYGTTVTSLTPTITKSSNSTISPSTAQDFSEPVTYTVTAQDTINTKAYKVKVVVEEED